MEPAFAHKSTDRIVAAVYDADDLATLSAVIDRRYS